MEVPLRLLALTVFLTSLTFSSTASAKNKSSRHDTVFVPVLLYHHVKLNKPSDDAIERGLTVLPKEFQAQLDYLARNHYHTVSAAALVRFLHSGGTLPPKPVVLTFDDGYKDIWQNAFPQLHRKKMTATFFIVPGFLGTPRYLTWSQVRYMSARAMDMEAHSMTHPDLTSLSPPRLKKEITQSGQVLQAHLHRSIKVFAYPYGAFNAGVIAAVLKAGYWGAFTTQSGWIARRDALPTLPRLHINQQDTLSIFSGILRGTSRGF